MNILQEVTQLLVQPPGDLVYFLVTLFALQQALFPALMARRAVPQSPQPRRWLWAVGGMLAGRVVLIILGLLGSANLLDPVIVLPPLERLLEVSGIALVLWALLGARPARWQTWLLLLLLLAGSGFYAYDASIWQARAVTEAYNGSFQEWNWEIAAVALLGLGLLIELFLHPPEWEWVVGVLVFWLAGHGAQLTWPLAQFYFPAWERLAALVVLPLLAGLVSRLLSTPVAASATTASALATSRSSSDVTGLQELLEGVESARELEPSLIITSSRLAHFLNAEVCAIALLEEEDSSQLRVVAIHPPTGLLETPILDLAAYEALNEIWEERITGVFQPAHCREWLEELYEVLGFQGSGPLLALPLLTRDQRVGMILLGDLQSKRRWGREDLWFPELTVALLAGAIARARHKGRTIFSLREQSEESLLKLQTAQEETAALGEQVATLEAKIQSRDSELARLNRELREQTPRASETELSFWQKEVKELAQDREMLIRERTRLGQEVAKLQPRLDALEEEREKLLERLAQQKEALESSTQVGTVGMLVADEDGTIVMADALARQMLSVPNGEVTGQSLDGVYPDPRWAQAIDMLLAPEDGAPLSALDSGRRQRVHLALQVGSRPVHADLVALMGRDGKPDALVVTLRSEESPVEQREAIVGQANEFRTPMTSITGYTDLLLGEQGGLLTEMQRQFLERVKANVEQMGQLLNDLVRLASPDARRVELAPEPVDLITVIEAGIMGLAARFRERHLAIRMDLPDTLTPVRADQDSLYQVILRLLSNAALCSQERTEVLLSAQEQEPEEKGSVPFIRISVTDTGGGIAAEDFPRVFRRFYRANQTLVQGMGETGVGMAVVKTLVEANGGRIWVETNPGVGSTFSFILPVYKEE
ncbi:MAG: GAF domain-containing protein [Anaerolineae bacterium]|nr:GAF domain-containing protein [Anaerolineae bacterium]